MTGVGESRLLELIRSHPASFRTAFPQREVRNIYFDTPNLTTYRANLDGIGIREKYRLRWYGKAWGYSPMARWETKIKDNQLGRKEVLNGALAFQRLGRLANEKELNKKPTHKEYGLRRASPVSLREKGPGACGGSRNSEHKESGDVLWTNIQPPSSWPPLLQPTLINAYQRAYFLSFDGQVRLTLDWSQQFWRWSDRLEKRPSTPDAIWPVRVIELKFSEPALPLARDIAQYFPFQRSKHSKYGTGVELLGL